MWDIPHGFETTTILLPTLKANIDTRLIASDIDSVIGAVIKIPWKQHPNKGPEIHTK